eukprot:GILK01009674.1.p1 GENE.GILK01009674.1~~GILK01009674.1.p1  ORF type:complete len:1390 (-),score=270.93 GILK01009674.1:238-4362(-)
MANEQPSSAAAPFAAATELTQNSEESVPMDLEELADLSPPSHVLSASSGTEQSSKTSAKASSKATSSSSSKVDEQLMNNVIAYLQMCVDMGSDKALPGKAKATFPKRDKLVHLLASNNYVEVVQYKPTVINTQLIPSGTVPDLLKHIIKLKESGQFLSAAPLAVQSKDGVKKDSSTKKSAKLVIPIESSDEETVIKKDKEKAVKPVVKETKKHKKLQRNNSSDAASLDKNVDFCLTCSDGGDLLCCETCPAAYHLSCLKPPISQFPEGEWNCKRCRELVSRGLTTENSFSLWEHQKKIRFDLDKFLASLDRFELESNQTSGQSESSQMDVDQPDSSPSESSVSSKASKRVAVQLSEPAVQSKLVSLVEGSALRGMAYVDALAMKAHEEQQDEFEDYGCEVAFLLRNVAGFAEGKVREDALTRSTNLLSVWSSEFPLLKAGCDMNSVMGYLEAYVCKLRLGQIESESERARWRADIETGLAHNDLWEAFGFDFSKHCLPTTKPDYCTHCSRYNDNSSRVVCALCGLKLDSKIDYGCITEAVVWSSLFYEAQIHMEMSLTEILQLARKCRPYRGFDDLGMNFFKLQCYMITHILYVLSDWGTLLLPADRFPHEIQFLRSHLNQVIQLDDPELVGEFLQCLRIFGFHRGERKEGNGVVTFEGGDEDLIRGVCYLLDKEKRLKLKGRWAPNTDNFYTRYHASYCAVVGLVPSVASLPAECGSAISETTRTEWIDTFAYVEAMEISTLLANAQKGDAAATSNLQQVAPTATVSASHMACQIIDDRHVPTRLGTSVVKMIRRVVQHQNERKILMKDVAKAMGLGEDELIALYKRLLHRTPVRIPVQEGAGSGRRVHYRMVFSEADCQSLIRVYKTQFAQQQEAEAAAATAMAAAPPNQDPDQVGPAPAAAGSEGSTPLPVLDAKAFVMFTKGAFEEDVRLAKAKLGQCSYCNQDKKHIVETCLKNHRFCKECMVSIEPTYEQTQAFSCALCLGRRPKKTKDSNRKSAQEPGSAKVPRKRHENTELIKSIVSNCAVCHRNGILGDFKLSSNLEKNPLFIQKRLLVCKGCDVRVHEGCYYGVQKQNKSEGEWRCERCEANETAGQTVCVLCPLLETNNIREVYRKTKEGGWVHLVCALWTPEVRFETPEALEGIVGTTQIPRDRWKAVCSICKDTSGRGVTISCSCPRCQNVFHVLCAARGSCHTEMTLMQHNDQATVCAAMFCRKHTSALKKRKRVAKLKDEPPAKQQKTEEKSHVSSAVPSDASSSQSSQSSQSSSTAAETSATASSTSEPVPMQISTAASSETSANPADLPPQTAPQLQDGDGPAEQAPTPMEAEATPVAPPQQIADATVIQTQEVETDSQRLAESESSSIGQSSDPMV